MDYKLQQKKQCLAYFEDMLEKGTARLITIEDKYGYRHGIANPEGVKAMLEAAIKVIKAQIEATIVASN